MPRTTRRPLTLHVSALSDAEYNAYTHSITELTSPVSDVDWDDVTMGVREARGWIRGRYGVDGAIIDQILRYFCPELGAHDMLTGGQFFAALRLVSHAQSGAIVDESLVFIQANPEPPSPSPAKARPVSHTAAFAQAPRSPSPHKPRPLSRTPSTKSAPPPPPRRTNSPETPSLPPRTAPPVPAHNPFTRTNSHPARSHPDSQSPPPLPDPPVSSNPFLRAQSIPQSKPAAPSASSASTASSSSPPNPKQYVYTSPPLPPRKPSTSNTPLLPPPRHASLTSSKASILSTSSSAALPAFPPPLPTAPIKPPKPPQATSPLIKQSLQAAKGAKSAQQALDGLSKERRLEVIKKSGMNGSGDFFTHANGSSSGSGSGGSGGGNNTPGPAHRPPSPPASFYDVAAARIRSSPMSMSSSSSSASSANHNPTSDSHTPGRPEFVHAVIPDTPPSPGTTNPRRTKSLHHPSPSTAPPPAHTPPAPPPRRKRPESVQVSSAGGSTFPNGADVRPPSSNGIHGRSTSGSTPTSAPSPLSRHLSFSHASEPGPGAGSVIDTLHRTFANLNQNLRPGPGFESARIKAEGRVWPGGYVKGLAGARGSGFEGREDGRRLVRGEEDGGFGQDEGAQERDGGSAAAMHGAELERDELKLPVGPGEGWSPLG